MSYQEKLKAEMINLTNEAVLKKANDANSSMQASITRQDCWKWEREEYLGELSRRGVSYKTDCFGFSEFR